MRLVMCSVHIQKGWAKRFLNRKKLEPTSLHYFRWILNPKKLSPREIIPRKQKSRMIINPKNDLPNVCRVLWEFNYILDLIPKIVELSESLAAY